MASYSELEAETSFSRLVEEAVAGEDVVVSRAGAPLVRIVAVPAAKPKAPRVFGQKVLGDAYFAPDWEDDLPLDIWEHLNDDPES